MQQARTKYEMSIYKTLMKNKEITELILTEEMEKKNVDFLSTGVIGLNLLCCGRVDGGIPIGRITQMAAPPSLGKSFVALTLVKNAQKKGMFCIFIDTERSFDFDWAKNVGIDVSEDKLMVIQENMIELVQTALMRISKSLTKDQKRNLFVAIDSWGNLVTDKTITDAEKGKDVKDMTITQKKNTLARLLLTTKATIFIANHTYAAIGGFGDPMAIPGGQVLYHNCSSVIVARSKAKDKENDEITGQLISCVCWKSRYGKEKSKFQFRIKHDGGLDIFYGLKDLALSHGCMVKDGNKYTRPHVKDDKKYWERELYTSDFWLPIYKQTDFRQYLEERYSFEGKVLDVSVMEIQEELADE
jgi:recombination protein RecA